ncbi:MAG: helix-turn-helix domain-containing protein, partial [Betaproteobacteria bacterium]|nr:helix-turn-helix domain-containing protein [Betaproteobacteria bacterium]
MSTNLPIFLVQVASYQKYSDWVQNKELLSSIRLVMDSVNRETGFSPVRTMDIKEAAAFLMVHPITLYKMVQRGEIPAAKIGKKWVFIDVDL